MEKILEGSLSHFEVVDLLTFLNLGRRSGVLVLERADRESKLFFREGRPVYATSTAEDLRLGRLLVRFKKVDPKALDQALDGRASGRIGQTLLLARILTEEELARLLKVQVSEVIFNTFEWREGVFAFFDQVSPPLTAVTLDIDVQNLVMEGVRRIDERSRLDQAIPDRGLIVEPIVNAERIKQSVTFTPAEWRVFFLLDGRRSVSEICRAVGDPDELATLQIVHNFVQAKFARLVPPGSGPAEDESIVGTLAGKSAPATVYLDATPAGPPPKVEFATIVPGRREEDDTKEIVNPQARAYQADGSRVTVSRLVLVKGGAEESFPLVRDSYTLGRHRNNDIVVSDPKASSFHARIDRAPEGFVLVDLESRNGCWVNGRRVASARLATGDEVRIGMARLLYRVDYQGPLG